MLSEYLFNTIKNGVPELTSGSKTHVYPMVVPDNVTPVLAVIYNEINTQYRMGLRTATMQLTCCAKSYEKCLGLSLAVERLFADKRFSVAGDPIATNVLSNKALEVDRDTGLHLRAVDIIISTRSESESVYTL